MGGGALYIAGANSATIQSTTFSSNSGRSAGGAIFVRDMNGVVTISDSSFVSNTLPIGGVGGGAIYYDVASIFGIRLYRNLFKNNSTTSGHGGAIRIQNSETEVIENCTFYGNTANGAGKYGGAIYVNGDQSLFGAATYSNNTIVGNSANLGGGGFSCMLCMGGVKFVNSILSNNTGGNCYGGLGFAVISLGYNIDSANTCALSGTGDFVNTDPLVVAVKLIQNFILKMISRRWK
jgi:predicted outer membrane repeat protein